MERRIGLKRTLGLFEVTLSGIGIILGAGIYALIGEAAGLAGNAVWISFALSAMVALLTGLSYAELASMFPRASAEYEYTGQAFGQIPAFLIGWMITFSGVIGAATVALGFAGYLRALTGAPGIPSAIALVVLLSSVMLLGVKQSAQLAMVFTTIEALGLVFVIVLGIPYLGRADYLEMPLGITGVFQASALIFFAFIGFEEIVKLSEEARDPEKNIPLGLVLAISSSIILYMLVALSSVSILGWQRLCQSNAPFAEIASAALGEGASSLISVVALFATGNTVLLMLLASSRIIYGMADAGALPGFLAAVHPVTRTPWKAIMISSALAIASVLPGDIAFVANINNFTVFVTFIVINAALIDLRYSRPDTIRPFRIPISAGRLPLLPVMGIASNSFMLMQLSPEVLAAGCTLALLGGVACLILKRMGLPSSQP